MNMIEYFTTHTEILFVLGVMAVLSILMFFLSSANKKRDSKKGTADNPAKQDEERK